MQPAENPYQASGAVPQAPAGLQAPPALKVAIGLYLLTCLLKLGATLSTGVPVHGLFIAMWMFAGIFTAGIAVALWRKQNAARMWVVFATAIPLVRMAFILRAGITVEVALMALDIPFRILVGVMMFLPSVRLWFAPKRLASAMTASRT